MSSNLQARRVLKNSSAEQVKLLNEVGIISFEDIAKHGSSLQFRHHLRHELGVRGLDASYFTISLTEDWFTQASETQHPGDIITPDK